GMEGDRIVDVAAAVPADLQRLRRGRAGEDGRGELDRIVDVLLLREDELFAVEGRLGAPVGHRAPEGELVRENPGGEGGLKLEHGEGVAVILRDGRDADNAPCAGVAVVAAAAGGKGRAIRVRTAWLRHNLESAGEG